MIISDQDIVLRDSSGQRPDSSVQQILLLTDTARTFDSLPVRKTVPQKQVEVKFFQSDTTSVCERNIISDVSFADPDNLVSHLEKPCNNAFPWSFIETNRKRELNEKKILTNHLKGGREIPVQYFHDDWIIVLLMTGAFVYTIIRTTSRKLFPEFTRFFLFRGINDPVSRDIQGLFHWQSTLLNLISFFNIALFSYCAATFYEFIPNGASGILYWLIAFAIVVAAVSARHALNTITGLISDESEVFSEYTIAMYHSYRYTGIVLFTLVILISYTEVFPVKPLLFTGFIVTGIFYLARVLRLFLIFIKRNISILYLILYLCALEFLPVIVLVKYFTGLF